MRVCFTIFASVCTVATEGADSLLEPIEMRTSREVAELAVSQFKADLIGGEINANDDPVGKLAYHGVGGTANVRLACSNPPIG